MILVVQKPNQKTFDFIETTTINLQMRVSSFPFHLSFLRIRQKNKDLNLFLKKLHFIVVLLHEMNLLYSRLFICLLM